jgi:hypothetical protein
MNTDKKRPLFSPVFFPAASIFLTAALGFLTGCPAFDFQDAGEALEIRSFYAQRADTADTSFYQISAFKLAEGNSCIVFADVNESISTAAAKAIADEYDNRIYPAVTGAFGDYMAAGYDVDGNGKTILLLLDIKDGYTGSGGYVAGYFDYTHMYSNEFYSNRADMIFIDVKPQIAGSLGFYVNTAHELQHLINYALHGGEPQELWLNEGLSSAAEYVYGGHRQDRISYFNNDEMQTIGYGNNFFVWDGYWEQETGDVLANYATAYLFFQWLRIHGGGNSIYRTISDSQYRDYRAVTQAAKSHISAIAETGNPEIWDRLLSSWMIANLVGASTGLYGYKEEIDARMKYYVKNKAMESFPFSPGEGIFSDLQDKSFDDRIDSGAHIKYLGISAQGIIDTTLPYTGEILLTYNANPNPDDADETGYVLSYSGVEDSPPAAARSAGPSSGALPSSYPVGVHDLRIRRSAKGPGGRPR